MNEIQGAIGLAQLAKLPAILAGQKKTKKPLLDALANYPFITLRKHHDAAGELATFLAFRLPDEKTAREFQKRLEANGVATGVMNYWHFVANMESVGSERSFPATQDLLDKTIFIEILLNMDVEKTREGITRVCASF